jgi:hypothetical protein
VTHLGKNFRCTLTTSVVLHSFHLFGGGAAAESKREACRKMATALSEPHLRPDVVYDLDTVVEIQFALLRVAQCRTGRLGARRIVVGVVSRLRTFLIAAKSKPNTSRARSKAAPGLDMSSCENKQRVVCAQVLE